MFENDLNTTYRKAYIYLLYYYNFGSTEIDGTHRGHQKYL